MTLRVSAEPGVDPVQVDSGKIGRVTAKLVCNALRYTSTGGAVEIRAWLADGESRVSVRDTGIGIEPDDLSRVCSRAFVYRGERSRGRT